MFQKFQNIDKNKLFSYAKTSGQYLMALVEAVYLTWQDKRTPKTLKIALASSMIYFLSPIDAIPDFLPGGFADDISLLLGTLYLVGTVGKEYLSESLKKRNLSILGTEP